MDPIIHYYLPCSFSEKMKIIFGIVPFNSVTNSLDGNSQVDVDMSFFLFL